jgi:hypothetical protein
VTARAHAREQAVDTGSVTLHGGGTQVVMLPAHAGRVVGLSIGGRQWLEAGPATRASELSLADGPSLCAAPPAFSLTTTADGQIARCIWDAGAASPRYEQTMLVRPDGTVVTQYALQNRSRSRIEYVWTAALRFALVPATRLVLPTGVAASLAEEHRVALGGAGTTFAWPNITCGEVTADLSRPFETLGADYAVRCALALPAAACTLAVEQAGARIELVVDGSTMPEAELWIDRHGFAARPRRRLLSPWRLAPGPECVVSLAPSTGSRRLEPSATASWQMTWRDGRAHGTS